MVGGALLCTVAIGEQDVAMTAQREGDAAASVKSNAAQKLALRIILTTRVFADTARRHGTSQCSKVALT